VSAFAAHTTDFAASRHPPFVTAVGDIYRLPDLLTGFSASQTKRRWCMVISVDRYSARVAPRSATSAEGVLVLRSARPDCFTQDGRFYDDWRTILLSDLRCYENRGPLREADRCAVLAQYRESLERRRRRRRSRKGRS
jgi:hypothetical protein